MGVLEKLKFLLYYIRYLNRKEIGKAEYVQREDNGYNRTWTSMLFTSHGIVVGSRTFFSSEPKHGIMWWTQMSRIKKWEF